MKAERTAHDKHLRVQCDAAVDVESAAAQIPEHTQICTSWRHKDPSQHPNNNGLKSYPKNTRNACLLEYLQYFLRLLMLPNTSHSAMPHHFVIKKNVHANAEAQELMNSIFVCV